MESIKITFLGTGNAIPTKLRNHTGILLDVMNEHILVDCGENIQRQFKIADTTASKLTKICITHWHGDHILGLPGLLQTLAMNSYNKTLKLYGPPGTKRYMGIIMELIKGIKINLEVHEVHPGVCVDEKNIIIEAAALKHGTPAYAYSIKLKDRVHLDKAKIKKFKIPNSPLLGQLQHGHDIMYEGKKIKAKSVTYLEEGKKVAIVLDTAMSESAVKIAKDADILIAEATFAQEEAELAKEYLHLTATDAATIAKKAKVKKLVLTHISERYEHIPHVIASEAKKVFKNTIVAKDFDVLTI